MVVIENNVSPSDSLLTAVEGGLQDAAQQAGGQPTVREVRFSASNQTVDSWQTRSVGTRDITVLADAPGTLTSWLQDILEKQRGADRKMAVMAAPRLRNTSAQILLHVAGQQAFRETKCSHFTTRLGPNEPGLAALSQSLGVPIGQLQQQADNLIDRRNAATHPCSLDGLDLEVAEVLETITPELEAMCRWEAKVVTHYPEIKAAFPSHFAPVALPQ